MTTYIDDRASIASFRRSVFGFLIGNGLGVVVVALLFTFDIGSLATSAVRSGHLTLFDLALLPATFGCLGLVVGPSVGRSVGAP